MFFDWLDIEQTFPEPLPVFNETLDIDENGNISVIPAAAEMGAIRVDCRTGEMSDHMKCFPIKYEGSYDDKITISVTGHTLRVRGNPSRIGREENLFGYTSIDQCVEAYNRLLRAYGLPGFSKTTSIKRGRCSRTGRAVLHGDGFNVRRVDRDTGRSTLVSDGAVLKEVHVTTNAAVGEGNETAYLKGIAHQPIAYSLPNLHPNGQTVDWRSERGNAPLVYRSVYCKAYELTLHALSKAKRAGRSTEYLNRVIAYCRQHGVVRFESKIKGRHLSRAGLRLYGTFEDAALFQVHRELVELDRKLSVTRTDMETIAQQLIREHVVESTKAANTTASYFFLWLNGQPMDTSKRQVKEHRARLRKIGIDIGKPADLTRFSPVNVIRAQEIVRTELAVPDWYQLPEAA